MFYFRNVGARDEKVQAKLKDGFGGAGAVGVAEAHRADGADVRGVATPGAWQNRAQQKQGAVLNGGFTKADELLSEGLPTV